MYGNESCTFLKEKKIIKESEPTWFSLSLFFKFVFFKCFICMEHI